MQGDIGHVIAHNSAPPDYSDYVGNLERNGDYNINIVDIEGPSFKSEGVLDALVQQVRILAPPGEQIREALSSSACHRS
jgi:hypothetical protein